MHLCSFPSADAADERRPAHRSAQPARATPPRARLAGHKRGGLVKVRRGTSGGCELARHPSDISALEVLEALEGRFGSLGLPPDATHGARAVRELWTRSTEAARAVLKAATLADLATRQQALEVDSHGYSI